MSPTPTTMRAVAVRDRAAGMDGLSLTDMPYPHAAENEVDWARNGSLAEYVAVQARDLAPLPADVDHTLAAALPISGLTAWQGLFDHGRLTAGQTVLIHGAAGAVGSIAVQLARDAGARVIGTGRATHRETALGLGAHVFVDLEADRLEDVGEVDLVFDVLGGEVRARSAALVRAGGTLVTVADPPQAARPKDGRAIFFVVESDRRQLADLAQRLRDGRLEVAVAVRTLSEAPAAFANRGRRPARTIIGVTAD